MVRLIVVIRHMCASQLMMRFVNAGQASSPQSAGLQNARFRSVGAVIVNCQRHFRVGLTGMPIMQLYVRGNYRCFDLLISSQFGEQYVKKIPSVSMPQQPYRGLFCPSGLFGVQPGS